MTALPGVAQDAL